ncbi:hypothetical protein Pyn_02765 [Prunus yedoensis var. nudiflora]|uniref:Uncharacterized protein n=1 Tax=Prunus yedoensis var. nudiflora TaxID=2094558 RepID=A0A314ZWL2_PRUYE|nr:hypothetical protein Pyn_02765 [Prunus yedoensis var. nudiflora]
MPLESEFRDQAPRMLRKGCKALENTLVTFTNENNGCLQINSWLGTRSLWHGSKGFRFEFSTEEKIKCSWGYMGIKKRDFEERFGWERREGKEKMAWALFPAARQVTLSNVRIA